GVSEAYARARELCRQLDQPQKLLFRPMLGPTGSKSGSIRAMARSTVLGERLARQAFDHAHPHGRACGGGLVLVIDAQDALLLWQEILNAGLLWRRPRRTPWVGLTRKRGAVGVHSERWWRSATLSGSAL